MPPINTLQESKLIPNPKIVLICSKLIIPLTKDVPDICKKPETDAAAPAMTVKGRKDKATILGNAKPIPTVNINKAINGETTEIILIKPSSVSNKAAINIKNSPDTIKYRQRILCSNFLVTKLPIK